MRITAKHVDAQVDALNHILGFDNVQYNTIGAISFRFVGNGGNTYSLATIANDGGGISSFYVNTLTPVSKYLDGLIQGARLMKWSKESD